VATEEPLSSSPTSGSAKEREVAGVYMGYKPKYTVNLFGGPGSGSFSPAPHFYLLSPDGRVYRTFDILKVPKSDPIRFDYAAARRNDPENSGHFTVQGGQLVMRFGRSGSETVTGTLTSEDMFTVSNVAYSRK